MDSIVLNFLVFSPLIGMIIILCLPKNKTKLIQLVGVLATLPSLVTISYIFVAHRMGKPLSDFALRLDWFQFGNGSNGNGQNFIVDYQMNIDVFSMTMLLLTAFLTTFAAIASYKIITELKGYYALFLLLEVGMLGVFSAGNMILFFLFFEMTLVSAFFLVGKWGYEQKEKAAYRFLIYNGIGSAILLLVIMTIQATVGTTDINYLIDNLADPTQSLMTDQMKMTLLIGVVLAFSIKLPSFPFHSWMLKMHTQAPIPVVMLHSGVLLKIGAYGLIRFGLEMFPEQFHDIAPFLALLGVFNLLYGAFLAFVQTDFKLMLAYSSVSHMGFVLMGLGAMNAMGFQGAIFQLISHGLLSALLFFLVGILYDRTKTTDIYQVGGLAKQAPMFSGVLLFSSMALLGLPGLANFVSEMMTFVGLFQTERVLAVVATISLVITAAYILNATMRMTFGELKLPSHISSFKDISALEAIPVAFLTCFITVLGIYPMLLGEDLGEFINFLVQRIEGW